MAPSRVKLLACAAALCAVRLPGSGNAVVIELGSRAGASARIHFHPWESNIKSLGALTPFWTSPSANTATVSATDGMLALAEGDAQVQATVGSPSAPTASGAT